MSVLSPSVLESLHIREQFRPPVTADEANWPWPTLTPGSLPLAVVQPAAKTHIVDVGRYLDAEPVRPVLCGRDTPGEVVTISYQQAQSHDFCIRCEKLFLGKQTGLEWFTHSTLTTQLRELTNRLYNVLDTPRIERPLHALWDPAWETAPVLPGKGPQLYALLWEITQKLWQQLGYRRQAKYQHLDIVRYAINLWFNQVDWLSKLQPDTIKKEFITHGWLRMISARGKVDWRVAMALKNEPDLGFLAGRGFGAELDTYSPSLEWFVADYWPQMVRNEQVLRPFTPPSPHSYSPISELDNLAPLSPHQSVDEPNSQFLQNLYYEQVKSLFVQRLEVLRERIGKSPWKLVFTESGFQRGTLSAMLPQRETALGRIAVVPDLEDVNFQLTYAFLSPTSIDADLGEHAPDPFEVFSWPDEIYETAAELRRAQGLEPGQALVAAKVALT